MRAKRLARLAAPIALTLAVGLGTFAQSPAAGRAERPVAQASPKPTATSSPRVRTTPPKVTGPGVGEPARHDAFASQAVRGIILILIAAAVVGWIFRARVRAWMIGRSGPPGPPPH